MKDLPPRPQAVMEIHNQHSGEHITPPKNPDSIETDQARPLLLLDNISCKI